MFELLRNDATLITATTRLSRELRNAYHKTRRDKGLLTWETPDILPCQSWISRTWQNMRSACESKNGKTDFAIILNPSQSRQLWKQIINQDILSHKSSEQPLWNIDATVKSAMDTWRICQEWDIDFSTFNQACLPDHRSFSRWAEQYQLRCRQHNWQDVHQLSEQIITLVNQGVKPDLRHLIWFGFGKLTPNQTRLCECLSASDITINISPGPAEQNSDPEPEKTFCEFESERDQWLAAAQWARRKLTENPQYRIAIVAPDLVQSRTGLEHALTQTLFPSGIIEPEKKSGALFHIALGNRLAGIPVVRSAINLLSLFTENPVTYESIACMMIDPFIRQSKPEMAQRHRLEYQCRQYFPYETTVSQAWKEITGKENKSATTPGLVRLFSHLNPLLGKSRQILPYSEWATLFLEWLDQFGWPGDETLGSADYQVVEAFRHELSALATLDMVAPRVPLAAAFSALVQRLNEQPFEPESSEADIEVMGILECTGIQFDAVWFGNLNEKDWPPRLRKSPFIPGTLQLAAGYFKSDIDLNREYARHLQQQLTSQCRQIVFSRPRFEENVELARSPLIPWQTCLPEPIPPETTLFNHYQLHKPKMEEFEDRTGLPITTRVIRGGTSVIENQSACHFRSYAIHRLKATETDYRQPGLNALERGGLVHRILEAIWEQIKTSQRLREMDKAELERLVCPLIDDCSRSWFDQSGLGRGFFKAQSRWLKSLMLEWLEVEQGRGQDFEVVETEQPYTLELGGLELTFKLDRIDRLTDGKNVLIDYKTGNVSGITAWTGERPQHPQLPLYALARISSRDGDISAMVYGQLRHGGCTYKGVTVKGPFGSTDGTRIPELEKTRLDGKLKSWPALHEHWLENLGNLAKSFSDGQAEVNPRDKTVCRNCNLTRLCRRHEMGQTS